jgi:NADPH:quinone reductase-like Zn-dependent oxidoreductase
MKAELLKTYGGVSVLKTQEVDLPCELDETEVLIEVHASGVNHHDCQVLFHDES